MRITNDTNRTIVLDPGDSVDVYVDEETKRGLVQRFTNVIITAVKDSHSGLTEERLMP